jgi:hypothetical protein
LKVIACVGETLEQREAGSTMEVVAAQTKAIAGTELLSDGYIQFFPLNRYYYCVFSGFLYQRSGLFLVRNCIRVSNFGINFLA